MKALVLLVALASLATAAACAASNPQPANDQTTVTVSPPDSAAPAGSSAPAK